MFNTSLPRCTLLVWAFIHAAFILQAQQAQFRVAFYNVENLFDTDDDPVKHDEDFTPAGKQQWTQERYTAKLARVAQVVKGLQYPALMGLCEVENAAVLQALCATDTLRQTPYRFVHFESPDFRGIDAALLYRSDAFTLDSSGFIRVDFPEWLEKEAYTSRDILYARLRHNDGSVFHAFVNHWPSRVGGERESEYRRFWVASHLRRSIDAVLLKDPLAQIFILGDFNDEPKNWSVSYALGSVRDEGAPVIPGLVYNPFFRINTKEIGSYNFRGAWNLLDQVMYVGLCAPNPWYSQTVGIFAPAWLTYTSQDGKNSPNRTYGGERYYGGYSDHYPVYLDVAKRNQ